MSVAFNAATYLVDRQTDRGLGERPASSPAAAPPPTPNSPTMSRG